MLPFRLETLLFPSIFTVVLARWELFDLSFDQDCGKTLITYPNVVVLSTGLGSRSSTSLYTLLVLICWACLMIDSDQAQAVNTALTNLEGRLHFALPFLANS
jgi:hypothetical protein